MDEKPAVKTPQSGTTGAIPIDRLSDWLGQDVLDEAGEKLGSLDAVFYDVVVDQPAFIAVKSGTLSKKVTLVPLDGAVAGRDYLRVRLSKSEFKGAPTHDPGVELSPTDEEDAYNLFGLPYKPAAPGARRLARR
jgi:PRC-barrel domain